MGKFWLKIWIWTKVIVFALVFLYLLTFVLNNLHNEAKVWYALDRQVTTNTLVMALCAFIAGVICTVLIRTTVVTMRQFRQVKERNRQEKLQRDVDAMKAASLMQPNTPGDSNTKT